MCYLVKQNIDVSHCSEVHEDAAFGVLGYGSSMDADAFAVGYVLDLGQHLPELRRPRPFEGVRAFGDEVVGVLEGVLDDRSQAEGECDRAVNGFTVRSRSCQYDFDHDSGVYSDSRYP